MTTQEYRIEFTYEGEVLRSDFTWIDKEHCQGTCDSINRAHPEQEAHVVEA